MRFEIDYARAKNMATRLQAFLDQNPKSKLSRSSAIEAAAQMLGFNNRNEMAARLEKASETATAAASPLTEATEAMARLLAFEIEAHAKAIAKLAREVAPDESFRDAISADTDDGSYVLRQCEDALAEALEADPVRRAMIVASGIEIDRRERGDDASSCAKALTDAALARAQDIWQEPGDAAAEDIPLSRDDIDEAVEIVIAAFEARENPDEALSHAARALTVPGGEPYGRIYADLRKGFIERHGGLPEDLTRFSVDVTAWLAGSLQVELSSDRVGEIDGEVRVMGTLEICAIDEHAAEARAKRLLEAEDNALRYRHLWNPRPDLGVRNLKWATEAREGDPEDFAVREHDLSEDHWQIDSSEIFDPEIDGIAPTDDT